MSKKGEDLVDVKKVLTTSRVVFWDFDGVIKDSNEVKANAFINLFHGCDFEIISKIKNHHMLNLGMSRYEKIPLYMSWSEQVLSVKRIAEYVNKFSRIVMDGVISAPWVPGVKEYIEQNKYNQHFILVTATPLDEAIEILKRLRFNSYFLGVYGAPQKKSMAISDGLSKIGCNINEAVMIGDGIVDFEAADAVGVKFLLRAHSANLELQRKCQNMCFENLKSII